MPLEWIAGWLALQAVGALVKPVVEDFAKDLAKDIAKDQAKGWFGKGVKLLHKDTQEKAIVKAVKELVQVIDEELVSAKVPAEQTIAWVNDIKQFVRTKEFKAALLAAFDASNSAVDASLLKQGWKSLGATGLPDEFDWEYVAKTFSRKLRTLREEDSDLRQIVEAQAAVDIADHTRQSLGVQPDFKLKSYREALLERYANLHFDSVDTSGANYSGVKLWSVFVPQTVRETRDYLPHAHEIPKEHLRRLIQRGDFDGNDMALAEELLADRQRAYLDQAPRSVLELIADERLQRFVILGDPGAGKSSLLQQIALEWARRDKPVDREALPLPLLIELKEYDRWDCPNGKSFVRYLHDAQNWHRLNQLDLDARLKDGKQKTILLLDGLDEVFDATRRTAAINDIQYFSNQYSNVRVIVTSRVIGYKPQRLADAEFQHFLLQDLDDDQINDFLDRWHDTTFSDARDRAVKKARLAKAISDSKAIRELAGNPLLLTMMAILNRNQELPRERITLYEQASKLLLHQWDVEFHELLSHPELSGHVGPKEKAEMLREIAYTMQSAPEGLAGNLISEDELLRILETYLKDKLGFPQPRKVARDLIEQLRERNFILCFRGGDSYSFIHRTFLEYFCATAIHQRFVQKLDLDYLVKEVYEPHWRDVRWHEVLCLVAGQVSELSIDHVAALIEFLAKQTDTKEYQHVFMAARCCQEIYNPQMLGVTFTITRNALESLLDPRNSTYVSFDFNLCDKAFSALLSFLPPESISQWLKQQATNNSNDTVRVLAIRELVNSWKDDPDILTILKQRATQDRSVRVRESAIWGVLKEWKDDLDTLPFLKQCVVQDNNAHLRVAAVHEVVKGWKYHLETLPWLKQRAIKDELWSVRLTAIQELAGSWGAEQDSLAILKHCAVQDVSEWVRQAAVEELSRHWMADSNIKYHLRQYSTKDSSKWVQTTAKRLLDEIEASQTQD